MGQTVRDVMDGEAEEEQRGDPKAGDTCATTVVDGVMEKLEGFLSQGPCQTLSCHRSCQSRFFCRLIFQKAMMMMLLVLPLKVKQLRCKKIHFN